MGYSLNNLSLMALTLSVGFVVDDAIVMLENIVRHMEMGEPRLTAAVNAAREIGFTILSMTFSLVAVFIPVLFMGGIVGRLLHEFSVTIVVAILISGFVSLTLTPMLGSRFLKHEHHGGHGLAYRALEGGFNLLQRWYEVTLGIAMRFRLVTLSIAILMLFGTVYLFVTMPTGFIPSQDSGFMFAGTLGPQDASFDWVAAHNHAAGEILRAHPDVQSVGVFVVGGNQAFMFANMKPREERTHSVDQIIEQLRPKMAAIPGLMVFMQNPPPITVSGQNSPSAYQMTLQSVNLKEIYEWAPQLTDKMRALPGFVDVNSDMQISSPQVMVDIDRDRAVSLGITPDQVQDALFSAYSARQVSVIYAPANQYEVILEVLPQYQRTPEALSKLYLRSGNNALVPLESVVRTHRQTGPLSINHFGQLPAVTVSFNLRPGFSLGQAAQQVDDTIREMRMPATIGASFQGTVKEFQSSFANLSILLGIAILVIYIVLGVLYESFIHPITILSGLPSAVFGALEDFSQGSRSLRVRGHHHVIRRGEEERHHDDRFRRRLAEAGAQRPRFHLAGLSAALPADHDDHRGGAVRHAADRAGLRRRRRRAATAGARRGGRPGSQPVPDAVHYPGNLPVFGAAARVAAGDAGDRRSSRGGIVSSTVGQDPRRLSCNLGAIESTQTDSCVI